jgi:hypothetical protein
LSQNAFFKDYDFQNRAVVKYLLQLDSIHLIKILINYEKFAEMIFSIGSFKNMVKANKKLFKIL